VEDDHGKAHHINPVAIEDGWHSVEIDWQAAGEAGADDGYLAVWVDGVLAQTLAGLDNDEQLIQAAALGVLSAPGAGTEGVLYLDAFESRTESYIGLDADGPVTESEEETTSDVGRNSQNAVLTTRRLRSLRENRLSFAKDSPVLFAKPQWQLAPLPDAPQRPVSAVASVSAAYTYDGDGRMVKSVVNDVTTYYVGGMYEVEVDGSDTTVRKYYSAAGIRIAMRTKVNSDPDTLNWLIGDHLGSTSIVTNASGVKISEVRYSAFGETRYTSGTTPTDYLYTGQRQEAEIGLYFYVARWYDPSIGRFLQADTIVPNPGSAKAFDRYSYAYNNPKLSSKCTSLIRT
jgi:RHS repeat-associated protein